jgi:hypothetical protein
VKPGRPWQTKKLDKLRAAQREDLECIPTSFLVKGRVVLPGNRIGPLGAYRQERLSKPTEQPAMAETYLRKLAKERRPEVAQLLAALRPGALALATNQAVTTIHLELQDDDPFPARLADDQTTVPIPDDQEVPLGQYALLLSLADQLSDDGYVDPRRPK